MDIRSMGNMGNMGNMMPPQVKMPEVNVKEAEKLKDSCNGFEAIFVNQMLKSMRSTLSGEGLLDGGTGMDIYKSMYDQHLADNIANSDNGIGIGDMLYRQLSKSLPKEKM